MARRDKDSIAWQKAVEWVHEVHNATGKFPKPEVYSLTDQIRQAAVSLPVPSRRTRAVQQSGVFSALSEIPGDRWQSVSPLARQKSDLAEPQAAERLKRGGELRRVRRRLTNSLSGRSTTRQLET
jgi:hypothetical protein